MTFIQTYLLRGDYGNAEALLNSLSEDNANQVQFKQVQEVNMKRIKGEEVYSREIDLVQTIALGNEPASGYARTLYSILTGIRLPIHFPDLDKSSAPRSSKTMFKSTMIYPNPTSGVVYIEANADIREIKVVDISGKQVLKMSPNSSRVEVDMSTFEYGIYIFHMVDQNGGVEKRKMIKL